MSERVVAFAPGRVNLIGEHTDYNGGLALPFAIDQGVTVTATPLDGGEVEVVALDLGEDDRFALDEPERAEGWRAFARGMVAELQAAGHELRPARLEVTGDVPQGSGLSSSAALEVALALALLRSDKVDRVALAKLCSKVENEWVGAETGLLDQTASLLGRADHALRIDFATLATEQVVCDLRGWTLVTVDSHEQHSNASGGYNERRAECREAAERLGVEHVAQADRAAAAELPEPLARRVLHVLDEDARVDATVGALAAGDLEAVARLLDQAHASMRDQYEASTPKVEETVAALKEHGAAGARIVGGGFGGHVLGLLPPGTEPPAGATVVTPADGARLR
ncbi:MAG TPA: galactokinase [Solirubrobacteraceae bacterium]|nr:galactokinase [Solirubrobacteraceae bacterium]